MPFYSYTSAEGETVERLFPMGEAPPEVHEQGTTFFKDMMADMRKSGRRKRAKGGWPLVSDSLGVHPDQIPEVQGYLEQHGVHCDFTPGGRAVLESRKHRKQVARIRGYHDNDGGYGDP